MVEQAKEHNAGYEDLVVDFLDAFELVFDADWQMTKDCLADPTHLISNEGTFLNPQVADEANNWHNRGALLAAYRNLRKMVPRR